MLLVNSCPGQRPEYSRLISDTSRADVTGRDCPTSNPKLLPMTTRRIDLEAEQTTTAGGCVALKYICAIASPRRTCGRTLGTSGTDGF